MARKPEANAVMKTMSAEAVRIGKECGVALDFSDASIRAVERLLGELHREFKKTRSDEGLRGMALMFAGYIGEVIRGKGSGGTWRRNHPELGEDTFPFDWKGSTIFPYGWCLKRIIDGKGDDVWLKYRALVLDAGREPGSVTSPSRGAAPSREPRRAGGASRRRPPHRPRRKA